MKTYLFDLLIFALPCYSLAADSLSNVNQIVNLEQIIFVSSKGINLLEDDISCRFHFSGKPSSYFYSIKLKEKIVSFEFWDTKKGMIVDTLLPAPLHKLSISDSIVDKNKGIKGQKADLHNLTTVSFSFISVPELSVNDSNNMISMNYKWSSDTTLQKSFTVKKSRLIDPYVIISLVELTLVVGFILWLSNR